MKTDKTCLEPHAHPTQLPSPGAHVSQYFRDIIAACRQEQPGSRLPAVELLKMFPSSAEEAETPLDDVCVDCSADPRCISDNGDATSRNASLHSLSRRKSQHGKERELLTRPEEALQKYGKIIICDSCDELTTHHFFKCNTCCSSNYDLCPQCFRKGTHCFQRDHLLREFSEYHNGEEYYTSVKETEKRDVIIV